MTGADLRNRLLVGFGHVHAANQHPLLAPLKGPSVRLLPHLPEAVPFLLRERRMVVPEHATPAPAGNLFQRWWRRDRLPCLKRVDGLRHKGEFLDEPSPVGNPGRREVVGLTVEGEAILIERQVDDLHCLVELEPVEPVGVCLVGVVEASDPGAQNLGLPWDGAPADSQNGTSARDVVEGGEVLGQSQGMPLGDDVERHADP